MKRHFRRQSIPWFRKHPARGTVYLMQSELQTDLFKVGFTKRQTKTRRAELHSKVEGRLLIRFTLSMPHAYFVEQLVIRRLRMRLFGRGDRRGSEWFRLRHFETIPHIIRRIERAGWLIRLIARLKLSWPSGAEIRTWKNLPKEYEP